MGTRQQGGAPPEVLGPHGIGQRNANGDLLLQLAVGKGLRLLNSFYQHDLAHTASWYHCRWHTPGVLDHAVCYQDHARCVDDVRAIPGAEVISDHRLMVMSLRLSAKPQLDFAGRRDRTFSQGVLRPRKLCLSKVTEAQHRQAFSTSLANGMATQQGPLTFDTLPRLLRTGEQAFGLLQTDRKLYTGFELVQEMRLPYTSSDRPDMTANELLESSKNPNGNSESLSFNKRHFDMTLQRHMENPSS